MHQKTKHGKPVTIGGLTATIVRGKFGQYRYRSPFWGYKTAYHFNTIITAYAQGRDKPVATLKAKDIGVVDIKEWLGGVSTFIQNAPTMNRVEAYKHAKLYGVDFGYLREVFTTQGGSTNA